MRRDDGGRGALAQRNLVADAVRIGGGPGAFSSGSVAQTMFARTSAFMAATSSTAASALRMSSVYVGGEHPPQASVAPMIPANGTCDPLHSVRPEHAAVPVRGPVLKIDLFSGDSGSI